MKNSEIIQTWNDTFFAGKEAESATYLAEDFMLSGPTPEPMNKAAYLGMMSAMKKAFPDLNNNLKITLDAGDKVEGTVQMAGTHTGDFDLTAMGMPVIPPTHKAFRLPEEKFELKLKEGKIAGFHVQVPAGGGLAGLLAQLGIGMPA